MSNSEQAVFQKQVNQSLKYLNEIGFGQTGVVYKYYEPSLIERVIHWTNLKWLKKQLPENLRDKPEEEIAKEVTETANIVLPQLLEPQVPLEKPRLQSRIREVLCPALKYVSNDIFEVAKVTTPVLLSLSAAGTIALPPQPMVYAIIAIVIARTGISVICAAYDKER